MSQSKNSPELNDMVFRAAFEQSAQSLAILEKGTLICANDAAIRILRIPSEQLQAWTIADLLKNTYPQDIPQLVQNPQAKNPAEIVLKDTGWFRFADSLEFFIDVSCTALAFSGAELQMLTVTRRSSNAEEVAEARQHTLFLESMVDAISDPYYMVDAETREVLFTNKAARRIAENPVGLPCSVLNPNGPNTCGNQGFCPLEICRKTGIPSTAEHVMIGEDGKKRFIEVHAHPVFDETGEVVRIIEHQIDTTAGRNIELNLRESEKRYSSLFENNHTVMLLVEPKTGAIVDANAAASEYYGYDRKTISRMNISHIALRTSGDTLVRAGQKALRLMTQHRLCGGESRDVEMFCGPISVGGQKRIYMIVHDITERSRIERALRERYDYETLAATLATRFIGFTGDELDTGIQLALKEIGRFTGVDRCTLYYAADTDDLFHTMFEWHASRVRPIQELIKQEPPESYVWLYERMQNFEAFRLSSLDELPSEAKSLEDLYKRIGVGSVLLVPFVTAGTTSGLIGLSLVKEGRKWSDNDVMLLRIVGEMIIRSLERRRLEEEVTQSRDRLKDLSAHIQERVENERAGIAREVHDELGQLLTALKFDVSLLKNKVPKDDSGAVAKTDSMSQLIDQAISSVQRISSELRPVLLDDLGLSAAVEWLARSFAERTGVVCELEIDDVQVKGSIATALFRICQEALTNVGRHSFATEVQLLLQRDDEGLHLRIADNGIGLPEVKLRDPESYGLIGLQERALFLEGTVSITGKKAEGTTIDVHIPFEQGQRSGE